MTQKWFTYLNNNSLKQLINVFYFFQTFSFNNRINFNMKIHPFKGKLLFVLFSKAQIFIKNIIKKQK